MQNLTQILNELLSGNASYGSFLIAFAVAYLGGILSSLTPCVYPMIPITVSVVGGIQVHGSHKLEQHRFREVMFRSIAYILGMTLVYSFLGVAAGLTGKIFGTFTNTPAWYIGLGSIMTIAALIMLEVVPFDPVVWWDSLKRKWYHKKPHHHSIEVKREMSWLGAFTLGAGSGLIAAPCTTPILTTILAFIAQTKSIGLGLGLMIFFSLGLGTLLLVVASFAGAIQLLPKSGLWLKKIKLISGLILLIFAEYLIFTAGTLGGI